MIETNCIYNEDCLIGMKKIPDGSVDCIITDLPYGTTRNHWDSVIPMDELWAEYKRIIKFNGAIVLFSQPPFTFSLACSNLSMFKHEIIWVKENSTGFLNANFAPLKIHENILVFSKASACFTKNLSKAMTYNPQKLIKGKPYKAKQHSGKSNNYDSKHMHDVITESNGDRFPTDVVHFCRDKEKFPPTQKPVALVEYLINTYSNEGDVVLDSCLGCGTTAIAAIRTGRKYIGFETNPEYYETARKRIEKEEAETLIFKIELI